MCDILIGLRSRSFRRNPGEYACVTLMDRWVFSVEQEVSRHKMWGRWVLIEKEMWD